MSSKALLLKETNSPALTTGNKLKRRPPGATCCRHGVSLARTQVRILTAALETDRTRTRSGDSMDRDMQGSEVQYVSYHEKDRRSVDGNRRDQRTRDLDSHSVVL